MVGSAAIRTGRSTAPPSAGSLNRALWALVSLALLVAACGGQEPSDGDDAHTIVIDGEQPEQADDGRGDEVDESPPEERHEEAPDTGGEPEERESDPGGAESDRDAGVEAEVEVEVPDDAGPVGAACRPYLRGEVPGLAIEVLHQQGARPRDGAVDHLHATMREVVDKPAGVRVEGPRRVPGGARTWSADDLRSFAAEHRTTRSTDGELAMVVLAVRGRYEEDGVLGVAVSATELVIFPDRLGDLTTSLLGGGGIERAVLVHEAGHLLCLVNIGYASEIDHEDPQHPSHSRHRESVMYWAIPNDAVTQVFSGPPPDTFHADDLADLEGLRTGRY